jgi:hypothetical protein
MSDGLNFIYPHAAQPTSQAALGKSLLRNRQLIMLWQGRLQCWNTQILPPYERLGICQVKIPKRFWVYLKS